jgi:hypothetical protein
MKPLNNLVVISSHTPQKCVRVLVSTMSIWLSKDNHDSWVTCTTSVECKIVITVVLTVMSSMNPHMISGTWDGFWLSLWLGCVEVGLLCCGSVAVRLHDAIEVVIVEEMGLLSYLLDGLMHKLLPLLFACQTESSLPCC